MNCPFCNTDDLTIIRTYGKGETLPVTMLTEQSVNGTASVSSRNELLSVSRRKVRCNSCNAKFFTVELFEKTAQQSMIKAVANIDVVMKQELNCNFGNDLTQEQKDNITKLLQDLT